MVLILFVQVLKKVLKSLKFELKYPGGTLYKKNRSFWSIQCIVGYCYKYTRAAYDWFCGQGHTFTTLFCYDHKCFLRTED